LRSGGDAREHVPDCLSCVFAAVTGFSLGGSLQAEEAERIKMTFEPISPPTILPVIVPNDYEAFRNILGSNIPDTYDEWFNQFEQWEKINSSNKSGIRRVNVNAAEFCRHLKATGAPSTLSNLLAFAESIANKD
jgi:hypothetical protein